MKMVPLSQIAEINPRQPKGLDDSLCISFLSMASVSEDGEITHQENRQFGDVRKGFTYFQRGDILLAKITPCFENGKSAITHELQQKIGFGSTEFHVLRAIPEKSFSEFLFYLVRNKRFRYLGQKSMKGAAGHKRVPKDFLEKYLVPYYKLDDQKRIAYLLGKVQNLISQRKTHLQQLDDLLKSTFLEMFGDPIANPKKFPVRKLSDFYISEKEGTKCGPFGSALKKNELVDSGIPVWNMDNIDPTGRMVLPFRMWITKEKYKDLLSYSVIDGDILISRAGTVGKMCVANMKGEPAIISTNLIRLRLDNKLRPLHLVSLMTYCKGRVGRLRVGSDGAFTHMNTGILDKLEFPYPPTELQDQFAAIVEKIDEIKVRYQKSLSEFESLYSTLGQQAFKGELDLSKIPLAESKGTDIGLPKFFAASDQTFKVSKKTIDRLNKFNEKQGSILKALQAPSALASLDIPTLKAAREMAEQVSLWRTPLDELKNMKSIARATEALTASPSVQKLTQEMASINESTKLAKQIADSLPKLDMSWLKEQQAMIRAATQPFTEMQKSMAALALPDETVRALEKSDQTMRSLQASLPDTLDLMPRFPALAVSMSREDEDEPRYFFTRHDILRALAEEPSLSVKGLMDKLIRLEVITQQGYEHIKKLVFELLNEGEIEQHYNDEDNCIALKALA